MTTRNSAATIGIPLLAVWYGLHVLLALAAIVLRVYQAALVKFEPSVVLPMSAQLVLMAALAVFWAVIAYGMALRRGHARLLAVIDNLLLIGAAGALAGWELLQRTPGGLLWLVVAGLVAVALWRSGRAGGLLGAALVLAVLVGGAYVQVVLEANPAQPETLAPLGALQWAMLAAVIALVLLRLLGDWERSFVIGVRDERVVTIALITPSLLLIVIFVYAFIAWSGWVSLSQWDGIQPNYAWKGLANYANLFASVRFQIDMRNTVFFTVVFITACLSVGLFLAVLLDQHLPGEGLFRSIFLFPMAISFVVTGVVWRWLLNPGSSVQDATGVNLLLHQLGFTSFNFRWFIDATVWPGTPIGSIQCCVPMGMTAIVLAAAWQMSGYTMALYLAGLRAIPEELREAARVDGASELQIYRHIVLPLLQPITLSAVIILGHISLKIFDLVAVITPDGGPGFITDVPALNMFQIIYKANRYADGAAIATVMLLTVAVLVVPYLISSARSEVQQ
jgi:glucose/mannose transport system permease protein